MPPKATLEEVKGFALTTSKLVFGGESAEVVGARSSRTSATSGRLLVNRKERQWILQTYAPMGDKENSPFFEEYLPKIYERRQETGLDEIVGDMRGVVVQVEHGDAINYLAELAAMGPYRFVTARLTDTHKVYFLQSQPEFPRLIVLEPLSPAYEDEMTRWNKLYPLAARKPNARYVGEVYARRRPSPRCARRSSRRTSASSTTATRRTPSTAAST